MERTLVLNGERVLKGVQVQPSAPQLGDGQAGLREKQCPNFFGPGRGLQAMIAFITSRELPSEMGRRFSGVLRK
jgi:hypothetical protein